MVLPKADKGISSYLYPFDLTLALEQGRLRILTKMANVRRSCQFAPFARRFFHPQASSAKVILATAATFGYFVIINTKSQTILQVCRLGEI
jgi:hypothetical protein